MVRWWKALDRVLRGEATKVSALRSGKVDLPVAGIVVLLLILAMLYGTCMGTFAILKGGEPSYQQVLASTLKVPALFFLTLVVTFPSLYVFNALVGSRLSIGAVLRLLLAAMAVTISVLASFGPITAFFSASTNTYAFMILLNVLVFAVSGTLGLLFLLRTLQRLNVAMREPVPTPAEEHVGVDKQGGERPATPSPLEPLEEEVLGRHVLILFQCWILLFGLVGAQMSWVLRPFVGNPDQPFTWFRPRQSNFFEAFFSALASLLS